MGGRGRRAHVSIAPTSAGGVAGSYLRPIAEHLRARGAGTSIRHRDAGRDGRHGHEHRHSAADRQRCGHAVAADGYGDRFSDHRPDDDHGDDRHADGNDGCHAHLYAALTDGDGHAHADGGRSEHRDSDRGAGDRHGNGDRGWNGCPDKYEQRGRHCHAHAHGHSDGHGDAVADSVVHGHRTDCGYAGRGDADEGANRWADAAGYLWRAHGAPAGEPEPGRR